MSSLRPDSPQQETSPGYPPGKGLFNPAIRQSQPDPLDAVLRKLNLDKNTLSAELCESLRNNAPQLLGPQMPAPEKKPVRDYLLAKSIRGKLAKSEFLERKFLPRDVLESLMSEENIQEALEAETVEYMGHIDLGYIKNHASKTFAALVYCNLVKEAIPLLGCGFRDIYLPIVRKQEHATSLSGIPRDHSALSAFRTWGEQEITEFCEKQWLFMPKTFTKECVMEDLHEDCPLPLLTYNNEGAGGSFSILHKATIHHAHQGIIKGKLTVAIKELKTTEAGDERQHAVEIDALDMSRKLSHKHIVNFVGGFRRRSKSYLMFQWASGGNLREFWNETSGRVRSASIVEWHVKQMFGLAGALYEWHNYLPATKMNCRHGDLKPENIVLSKHSELDGNFQIADLGLAKVHSLPTHVRNKPSLSPSGTFRYRSPEIGFGSKKISRSYDMWGIGCVFLEWIIWLLYGREELKRFHDESFDFEMDGFFVPTGDDERCIIRPNIQRWMDHIESTCLKSGEECFSGALRDLFLFIREKLLVEDPEIEIINSDTDAPTVSVDNTTGPPEIKVIPDPTTEQKPTNVGRAKSDDLLSALRKIVSNGSTDYIYNSRLGIEASPPASASTLRVPQNGREATTATSRQHPERQANTKNPYAISSALDIWNTHSDIIFAKGIFSNLETKEVLELTPAKAVGTSLCKECSDPDMGLFSRSSFSKSFANAYKRSSTCTVCAVILEKMDGMPEKNSEKMLLREESSLTTARGESPVLSIVVGPTQDLNNVPDNVQRGFPILPRPGSNVQFKLLRAWLEHCDRAHECKPNTDISGDVFMPLRLVYVGPLKDDHGNDDPNALRLDCKPNRTDQKYAALTHRWGDPGVHGNFCLSRGNLGSWQKRLDLLALPRTFRDAVKVARGLRIHYLWIDTLCIIQDNEADLQAQIRKMEDVFKSAYVTLSATCATGTTDGFLKREGKERQYRQIRINNEPNNSGQFYLCDPIDNFKRDVEQSALSKRGWIFQERALSRRIIHFTATQIYWECGRGIRCESLTKMYNRKTSFLSDPCFPDAMLKQYKGMRILFFEEIYGKYSQLEFTHPTDRLVGMAGIESRLAEIFGHAQYGILYDPKDFSYLPRTLLWERADLEHVLTKIDYPPNKQVPSWSWMAVMGPICFMDIPFGGVDWDRDFESPFNGPQNTPQALFGNARDFVRQNDDRLIFDRHMDAPLHIHLKCMVLGTKTESIGHTRTKKHYGILVVAREADDGSYERVGVATFERDSNWLTRDCGVTVRII